MEQPRLTLRPPQEHLVDTLRSVAHEPAAQLEFIAKINQWRQLSHYLLPLAYLGGGGGLQQPVPQRGQPIAGGGGAQQVLKRGAPQQVQIGGIRLGGRVLFGLPERQGGPVTTSRLSPSVLIFTYSR